MFFLDIMRDEVVWRQMLDDIEKLMEGRRSPNMAITVDDPIYRRVAANIPWDIARVQGCRLPKARRFPVDIPYTHRAAILLQADQQLMIEVDAVKELHFMCTRFVAPVRFGVFVYGVAPESEHPRQPPPQQGEQQPEQDDD